MRMELNTNRRDRDAVSGRTLDRERATHLPENFPGDPLLDKRIQHRIRQLCSRVIASDGHSLQTLAELRCALHEHNQKLRLLAVRKLLGGKSRVRVGNLSNGRDREVSSASLL